MDPGFTAAKSFFCRRLLSTRINRLSTENPLDAGCGHGYLEMVSSWKEAFELSTGMQEVCNCAATCIMKR